MVVIASWILYRYVAPKGWREWTRAGLVQAFIKTKGTRASLTSSGYQEQMVLVKGGYTPDVIVVERGKPVRLNFVRQESASCSEMVLFPTFNKSTKLPEGKTVLVEFMPKDPGEYDFSCQMGMFEGKLIVE